MYYFVEFDSLNFDFQFVIDYMMFVMIDMIDYFGVIDSLKSDFQFVIDYMMFVMWCFDFDNMYRPWKNPVY